LRLDVAFYVLGIVCFALVAYIPFTGEINLITSAFMIVLILFGLLFIAFGYSTRPRKIPLIRQPPAPIETKPEEEVPQPTPPAAEPSLPAKELTKIKGIGPKRLAQLKALQIQSIDDLAQCSAKDLAAKTGISKKTTAKWIEEAKNLSKKGA